MSTYFPKERRAALVRNVNDGTVSECSREKSMTGEISVLFGYELRASPSTVHPVVRLPRRA